MALLSETKQTTMLGTQRKAEQGVIQSSIALLQERFKQVQRVKEMREKRQLVENFSTHNINNNNNPTCCITISTINNSIPTMDNAHLSLNNNYYYNNNDSLSIDNDDDSYVNYHKLQLFPPSSRYKYSYQLSSSPSSSTSSSSSSSLLNNGNLIHHSQDDASLSLWLPLSPSDTRLRSPREYYAQSHVSDVDTTLHL